MMRRGEVPRRQPAGDGRSAQSLADRRRAEVEQRNLLVKELVAAASPCDGCGQPVVRAQGHSGWVFVCEPQPNMKAPLIVVVSSTGAPRIEHRGRDREPVGFWPHVCPQTNNPQ